MTYALYSALYGGYEYAKPLPADLGCPAVLYTDEPDIHAPGWEVRVVDDHFPPEGPWNLLRPDRSASRGMMAHKYWKCHPAEALPDVEVSLWIDASILITADRYLKRCVEALGDDDWCAVRHPHRTCIYDEAAFSATLARYDADALARQASFYADTGHPKHWGLFATGANVRRHTPATIAMGEHWWYECLTRSHQDQISLPVLFRLAEQGGPIDGPLDHPFRWNTNMPWDSWWGVYEHGRPPL